MTDIKSSALWEIVQSLTRYEVNALRRWLQSPFFNHRPELIRLLDELDSHRRAAGSISKEDIFRAVFLEEKTYNDAILRHSMSFLLQQIRQFLAWQEWNEASNHQQFYEVRAMRKRNLDKNFNYCYKNATEKLEKEHERQLDDAYVQFMLRYEYYEWESKRRRAQEFPLEDLAIDLGAYFSAHLFRLACVAKSQAALYSQPVQLPLLDTVAGGFMQSKLSLLPLPSLYYQGYQMLLTPNDESSASAFKSLLEQHLHAVPPAEARDLLMLVINQCIRRINQGERDFLIQALDWYEWGLSQKVLFDERGELSPYTYNNILMLALALNDWPRAKAFLEQYRGLLPAADRDNVYHYNLSVYLFRKGDYDQALGIMRNVAFRDPMYYLESRKMLLKIYFEQGATDALESLIENLQAWLRRHSELGYHREMYRNLARFTRRLLYLAPSDRAEKLLLEKEISKTELLAEREWLLENIKNV